MRMWCPRPESNRHDRQIEGFSCRTWSPKPPHFHFPNHGVDGLDYIITLGPRLNGPALRGSYLFPRAISGVGRVVSEGPTTASLLIACAWGLSPFSPINSGRGQRLAPPGYSGIPAYSPILLPASRPEHSIAAKVPFGLSKVPCVYQFHHSSAGRLLLMQL